MGKTVAILVARLIFAAAFAMAAGFKFAGMQTTADYIAAAGFPIPLVLAWVAAFFEVALVIGFLTGAFFSEAALLAAVYVIFLAFAFHGPVALERQSGGIRLLHRPFHLHGRPSVRRVHGPGEKLAMRSGIIWK